MILLALVLLSFIALGEHRPIQFVAKSSIVPQYRGLPGANLTGMLFYVLLAPVVS